MKLAVVILTILFPLSAISQTTPDEVFLQKVREGVASVGKENPKVRVIATGKAQLLNSHRQSKIGCRSTNAHPKDGEHSETEPVWPKRQSIDEVVAQEIEVEADKTEATWIAWVNCEGKLFLAFNSLAIGEYEISTVWEVQDADDQDWKCWGVYRLAGKAKSKDDWTVYIHSKKSMEWRLLELGKFKGDGDLEEKLSVLEKIGVISLPQIDK